MATGDTYRRIQPDDQLIFDSSNKLVGVRSGRSTSAEMRGLTEAQAIATQALVSGAGIVVNDTSAATANVAALQAALTAGGIVNVIGPGICWINETLVIYSDTDLCLQAGLTIKLVGSTQKRLLQNAAYTASSVSIASMTASGYVGTVTRTAHGRAVGDWVSIEGSTTTGYNGTYRVETVPTANTYTVTLPIAPATTTAAGTLVEYTADHDITIRGGTWDGNGENRTAAGNLQDMGLLLARVGKLHIDSSVKSPRKYCWLLANCANVSGGVLYCENRYSDGLHIMGPIIGLDVAGVTGYTHDDLFACTLGDYAAYQVTTGDMYGIHVGQIAGRTDLAGFKITGQAPFKLYDARVDHFRVAPGTDAVSIITDTNLQQTNVGQLSFGYFEDLACNVARAGVYATWNGSGTVTVDAISFDSVRLRPTNVAHSLVYNVNGACTIKRVTINHIDAVGTTAGASAAPRVVRQIGDVTELSITGRVDNYHSFYDHDSSGSASGQRVYVNGLTQSGCNQGIGFRRAITVQSSGWETISTGTAALSSGSAATCTFIGQIKAESAGKYANLSGSARVTPYSTTLQVDGDFVTGATGATFYNTDTTWASGSGTDKSGQYGYTGSAWTKLYGPA